MNREYSKQLSYDLLREGGTTQRETVTIEYVEVPLLPTSGTLESMFRRAVSELPDGTLRRVLNDLFRYLVFSNHVRYGTPGDRTATFVLLDSQHPFAGQIDEAENFTAGTRRSGSTDTCGAVIDLILRTQSSREVTLLIGGILFAMLANKTVIRRKPNPYIPKIEIGR